MAEVTLKARELIEAREVVGRLLIIHVSLPVALDGGRSARAGVRLRRVRRVLAEAAERVQGDIDEAREAAKVDARGGDARAVAEANQRAAEAAALILNGPVSVSVPELLTREDWDAIPQSAEHIMPNVDERGQPVTVTLRKTEADLDALGDLVSDADDLGGAP